MLPVMNDAERLCQRALEARENAYAPYSRFRVGAALLCEDGTVVLGVNVENVSYGLCLCAERAAIGAAISQGERRFAAIAIATASSPPSAPCGMCRQTLAEFNQEMKVYLVNTSGARVDTTLIELFPGAFDKNQLEDGADR